MTSVFNVPITYDNDDNLIENFDSENSQVSLEQDTCVESIPSAKISEQSGLDNDEDSNINFDLESSDDEDDKIYPLNNNGEDVIFESVIKEKVTPESSESPELESPELESPELESPELEQIKSKLAKLTNETFQIRKETAKLHEKYKKVLIERLAVYWYTKTGLKRKLNFDDKLAVPKLRTAIGKEIQKLTKILYHLDSIHSFDNKFIREIKRNLVYTINDKDLTQLEIFLKKVNHFLQVDKELNQSQIQPKNKTTKKLHNLRSKIVDSTTNVTIIVDTRDDPIKKSIVNNKVQVKFDQSDKRLKIMVPGFKILEFDASHYSLIPYETTYSITKENKIIIYVPKLNEHNIFYQNKFKHPYSYFKNNINNGLQQRNTAFYC